MHPVIWRLSGFVFGMLIAWGLITLFLILPGPERSWPAWQIAGMAVVKCTVVVTAAHSLITGFSWLANPPEQD